MDSKVVRADFGSGLICPRAQTCCAELRRLARLANSPGFKSFHCPRWLIKFSLERFSVSVAIPLACPAVGMFSRACSAGGRLRLQIKFHKSDRVGRRGLSEPREDFSRLHTYGIPWLDSVAVSVAVSVAHPLACTAVGKFSRASSAGGRRNL